MRTRWVRLLAGATLATLLVGGTAALWSGGSRPAGPVSRQLSGVSFASTLRADGSLVKFRLLADKTSNSCGLQPGVVMGMSDGMRLQGSCCSAMDAKSYAAQVRGLHGLRDVMQIPRDPYDIPVTLVKRLLIYDRSVRLDTRQQQRTYSMAMAMSPEKGPCCCHCWRWTAFQGLGKYLIARRGWSAPHLGRLIGLLDGCGGPGHGSPA